MFTTVREANVEFARSMGADVIIDYEKEDYVDAVIRERRVAAALMLCSTPSAATHCHVAPTYSRNLAASSRSWTLHSHKTSFRPGARTRVITSFSPVAEPRQA